MGRLLIVVTAHGRENVGGGFEERPGGWRRSLPATTARLYRLFVRGRCHTTSARTAQARHVTVARTTSRHP